MEYFTLNTPHGLIPLKSPIVMGIINCTPDSFVASSRSVYIEETVEKAGKMIEDGATIIDLGGMSTRPGAVAVDESEEIERLIPSVKEIRKAFPDIFISIDTYRSGVAMEAIQHGADIINDISAGSFDPEIIQVAAKYQVPYVLMHMQGEPSTMQHNPVYSDVVHDIMHWLSVKINEIKSAGVHDIIIDPGFGFGKLLQHNYQLLHSLSLMHETFQLPVLAGVSRKRMICELLKVKPEQALNGTVVAQTIALLNGASILRVHDVKEAVEAIQIVEAYQHFNSNR